MDKPSRFIDLLPIIFLLLTAQISTLHGQGSKYPPMKGFNAEGSDARAIQIADNVMEKMGGWESWDKTRYVTWRFFGRRLHVWDKWTGNVRIEANGLTILMNINTKKGKAWEDGKPVVDPDTLADRLERGYRMWVNDSYWVFMPYKLKDSGVTLKYMGMSETEDGRPAHMLQLTFENVGVTPQNRYEVYVDQERGMVTQWSYFQNASDEKPGFTLPWKNWQKYGHIMLSDDRGRSKHSDLAVFDELPDRVFESPEPVDMMGLAKKDKTPGTAKR